MTVLSAAVVDALNSLIETERGSIFRLMGDDSRYLREASPQVRRVLEEEKEASYRHADELRQLVRQLHGQPVPAARTATDPPLLEFISLRFLLPKLVDDKELLIRHYHNVLRALGSDGPEVEQVLRRHVAEHEAHLQVLRSASAGK